jgi:murein endopeptidase
MGLAPIAIEMRQNQAGMRGDSWLDLGNVANLLIEEAGDLPLLLPRQKAALVQVDELWVRLRNPSVSRAKLDPLRKVIVSRVLLDPAIEKDLCGIVEKHKRHARAR